MPKSRFNFRILVVDDEPTVRDVSKLVLESEGYEVRTAENGFEALANLQGSLPDLIVSDLKMPSMSGFELLSVIRRRFPHIPVIAISGEYDGISPEGLLCDAYFAKAQYTPEQLFAKISELIRESPLRPHAGKALYAPVWLPRSTTGYYVLTCTECLRSFSIPETMVPEGQEVCKTECIFCDAMVRFFVQKDGANSEGSGVAESKRKVG